MKPLDFTLEGRRAAIVAAHPDDETIGAGACLGQMPGTVFIHVTDGAPRDMRDALANGFSSREAYAQARRREFLNAVKTGGLTPAGTVALGYTDQEASLHLVEIARDLCRLFDRLALDTILVHPYEGGHPDHDAAAFAVHLAWRLRPPESRPRLIEFASYHNHSGEMEAGVFLPDKGLPQITIHLDSEARARKRLMLACYRTQQAVLGQFGTREERFRVAPEYDFAAPPHAGRLFYEQFPWGMTGGRWLELARTAQEQLRQC